MFSALLAASGAARAAEAERELKAKYDGAVTAASAATEKIEAALEEPTQLEFVETPLSDAMDFISDYHSIPVRLDGKKIEELGIALDMPVNANVQGIPLRSGLNLLLRGSGLTWVVQDDVLWITSVEAAEAMFSVRVYPVRDLVRTPESVLNDKRNVQADYEPLIEAVEGSVAPPSWAEQGGTGTITAFPFAESLVIYQTYHGHREVQRLLSALRLAREIGK